MNLLKYYIENKINPVPIKFHTKKDYENHFIKRENLIQNHLKIPLGLIKNLKYLEFGPNTAENACFFANYNAEIFLVEPNVNTHKIIKKNFHNIGKLKQLKQLSSKTLEDYSSKKKFDLVIAEGFLNTLNKREKYLKKLSNYLNNKSILIINFDDKFGGLFEQIKSYLLLKICNLKSINKLSKESYKLSKTLFYNEFKKLKTSRNFHAWWADQLVNSFASNTWSLREIIKFANKNKLKIYSTSPMFDESNNFQWYKNINKNFKEIKKNNQIFYKEWKKSLLSIILGKKKKILNLDNNTITEINNFSDSLCKVIARSDNKYFNVKISNKLVKLLNNYESKTLAKELKELFLLIEKNKNPNKIINFYIKSKRLKQTWGSLLHYVALIKN